MTLLQEDVKALFDYDPPSGICTLKVDRHKAKAGEPIDERYVYKKGYALIGLKGKPYLLHRLIWLWMTGSFPDNEIDHINGDKMDNRWENLRDVTRAEQMHNRAVWGASKASIGTRKVPSGRWQAHITTDGQKHYLGTYDSEEAAMRAYLQAKILFHGTTRYSTENPTS